MFRSLSVCVAVLVLTGCEGIQTTSGVEYLEGYTIAPAAYSDGSPRIDPDIAEAASFEPTLRFPARIGLARVVRGTLTGIPGEEQGLWAELAEKHAGLGSFVAVSPLIAALGSATPTSRQHRYCRGSWSGSADWGICQTVLSREFVKTVRLASARQHLDAVLIYELGAYGSKENTILALFDVTLIGGAILPTRSLEARGEASAILVDVRSGYPYATASADVELSELSISYGSDKARDDLISEAMLKTVEELLPEIDGIAANLVKSQTLGRGGPT